MEPSTKSDALARAIMRDNDEAVAECLAQGELVNGRTALGMPYLSLALLHGKNKASVELIRSGASVSSLSPKGFTPFAFACKNPQTSPEVVELLLERGASPYEKGHDSSVTGETAFMDAAFYGEHKTVTHILDTFWLHNRLAGKTIAGHIGDYVGDSSRGYNKLLEKLFIEELRDKSLADLVNHKNSAGETALVRAYERRNESPYSVATIIDYGASKEESNRYGNGIVDLAAEQDHVHHLAIALRRGAVSRDKEKLLGTIHQRIYKMKESTNLIGNLFITAAKEQKPVEKKEELLREKAALDAAISRQRKLCEMLNQSSTTSNNE